MAYAAPMQGPRGKQRIALRWGRLLPAGGCCPAAVLPGMPALSVTLCLLACPVPVPSRMQRLPSILRDVIQEEGLAGLPLFAFGASSGGSLALRLAAVMPEVQVRGVRAGCCALLACESMQLRGAVASPLLRVPARPQGVICQITPVNPLALEVDGGGSRRFPPTVFVHMAQRDPEKAETVAEAIKILK